MIRQLRITVLSAVAVFLLVSATELGAGESVAASEGSAPAPPGGEKIAQLPAEERIVRQYTNSATEITLVPVEGGGSESVRGKRAFRVRTLKPLRSVWEVQLCDTTLAPVRRGQPALLRFWARTIDVPGQPQGQGKVAVYFQRASEPWDKSFLIKRDVPRQWTLYQYPFRIHEMFGKAEAHICLGFGFDPQTVEVSGLQVRAYGSDVELETLPRSPEAE